MLRHATLTMWVAMLAAGGALAAELPALWQIGQADNNTAEFAFAPKDYAQYRTPALFVVGASDPKRDWPYVQPGTIDGGWAPGTPQTFQVLFGLKAVPSADCQLVLDFADTHYMDPPALRVEVNDKAWDFQTPKGAGDASVYGDPSKGREHVIAVPVPAATLKAGENRVAITTVRGSWVLWDALRFEAPAGTETAPVAACTALQDARSANVLVTREGKLFQPATVTLRRIGEPTDVTVRVGEGPAVTARLAGGVQAVEVLVPPVETPVTNTVTVEAAGQLLARRALTFAPVRKWVVYLLPHSHVDIGYTHVQTEVEHAQWKYLEMAIATARRTADYPPDARFKWNVEVMWAVDSYLAQATPAQCQAFVETVKAGQLGLQALYGNMLTGLCRGEELVRTMSCAQRVAALCGQPVTSAMITDVPGYTWGVVSAMAQSGVKYFSMGPNGGDRIGYTAVAWGDKPFWWVGPNGNERILAWMTGTGYYRVFSSGENLMRYLDRLSAQGYPYDFVQVRHCLGDNGAPDVDFPDQVRKWNETHAYPRLVIATSEQMFRDFEARYGNVLPVARGDFTPYWEDGAPSSAQETALNRAAADRLTQAETLFAMLDRQTYPADGFYRAWRNVILYDEHTWGAHNSISQPDAPFVTSQWAIKRAFAVDAERQSRELLVQAVAPSHPIPSFPGYVDVYNTASWPRTDLVTLSRETQGDVVKDAAGGPVPSQRLAGGELAFLATDVPAFGTKRYRVEAGAAPRLGHAAASGATLTTPQFTVKVDEATGTITSLRQQGLDAELVDGKLNDYIYLPGGNVKDAQPGGPARVTIKDAGPLVASLLIESDAPGCRKLSREVRVVDGLDRVELVNTVDKLPVRAVEGVHFGFAFNVPQARVRMNSALAVAEPGKDQLPGACKNWFSVERWADVANASYGVTWATVDAPLVELGGLTANLPRGQSNPNAYLKTIEHSPKLYSWAMNNHWHTNYKADQEGLTVFRYAIRPHRGYDALAAHRFGIESSMPLLVAEATNPAPPPPRLRIEPNDVVATAFKPSEDGKAWIVRLFGASGKDTRVSLKWTAPEPPALWASDASEQPLSPQKGLVAVPAWGLVTLRADRGVPAQ